jgi:hypothetical protein
MLVGSKLGELVPYFEYFDLVTQFEIRKFHIRERFC